MIRRIFGSPGSLDFTSGTFREFTSVLPVVLIGGVSSHTPPPTPPQSLRFCSQVDLLTMALCGRKGIIAHNYIEHFFLLFEN